MWLVCSECGSTLPSARSRCPCCGQQPPPEVRPPRRRAVWPLLVVLGLLGGATAGVLVLKPPILTTWADQAGLRLG